ncbi:MAG: PEP-CTERM sorting domain-containing protein [Gammaproteobacteria bacterium]|nr:PEP-CTERM sorting domain-containing protein [Gammaproteobacteria bacterium]
MKNIKTTKSSMAAVAVAGSFALLGASAVQADVLATSVLQINNLTFSKTGGATLDIADFGGGITYTSTADISAELGGVTVSDSDSTILAATIDLAPACVGTCPAIVDNAFPIFSAGAGDPSSQFAAADQYQADSPISGIGAAVGADIESSAYVSLLGQNTGSSTGNNNLNSSWVFAGYSGSIDVDFDATAYLEAFVSPDSLFPSFATASYSVVFTVVDLSLGGLVVDNWVVGSTIDADNPFSLNDTRSANSPFANGLPLYAGAGLGAANSGHFTYTSSVYDASHAYQLSTRATTTADATMVPEPGMIALLGAGLLGLGFSRKRREA